MQHFKIQIIDPEIHDDEIQHEKIHQQDHEIQHDENDVVINS